VLVLPLRNPVVRRSRWQPRRDLGRPPDPRRGRGLVRTASSTRSGCRSSSAASSSSATSTSSIELWTQERVTLQVDEFNLREAVMVPRTRQRPRPPILIGGYVDAVLKRAGTVGDGWLTYFYTPESFTKGWEKVKTFAREAGRDPKTLSSTNQLAVVRGQLREPRPPRYATRGSRPSGTPRPWSESTIEHAIHGSAEECVAQLKAHVKTGVDRIILIPYRYQPEQVERIAKEVLPSYDDLHRHQLRHGRELRPLDPGADDEIMPNITSANVACGFHGGDPT
jgi:hypothetical protein